MSSPQETPSAADLMRILAEMEQQAPSGDPGMLLRDEGNRLWDGLAYSIAGVRVVTAMGEVREMLPYPDRLTRVPGVQEWMQGLANIRGNLLPVVDLQLFLGAKGVVPGKAARMLIIRMRGIECGILVPAVHGMRHFEEAQRLPNARMKGMLGRYVFDAFSEGSGIWPVFSISALTADPMFRSATV